MKSPAKRRRTLGAFAAIPVALTLALTGCGSNDGGSEVASAGGAKKPAGGSSAASGLSQEEKGLKFAQCMREHGIDMEDPVDGKIMMRKQEGLSQADMQAAQDACKQYSPMGEGKRPGPEMEKKAQEFAECMRGNGVDMPDPEPGQGGIRIDKKIGEDPDFPKAQKECEKILRGEGKGGAQ
ncbi:hypothetical protein ABZ611_06220 [Streptomyces sp. NPDC007861]|uniref:hypothetical protein n=1 Tax=Streptomyces sp. NPDC007861 TaxID=3154893 RepID=UPI0033F27161